MQIFPRRYQTTSKRRNLWGLEILSTILQRLIHRAGRLIRPQGALTPVLGGDERVPDELEIDLNN